MKEVYNGVNRRSVLKSASGLIGGSLMAGSAAAAKDKKAIGNQKSNKFEKLTDSITVANGKAKVKGQANALGKEKAKRRTSGKEKVEISANGKSLTFTVQKIVKQMNKGVEKGYWKIKESAGELDIDLTEKGRSEFFKSDNNRQGEVRIQSHCNGKSEINGDVAYLGDDAVDEIQWGSVLTAGTFTIATAIAAYFGATALAPVVMAAAAVLATVTAAYIGLTNEGCGIKIGTDSDVVSSQHCDC
ncbi:hypothetical protein [Natrinema longum]|uniref:Uncharacterized protein n=1 Tax=Natrinema longum TaxID=370324 RepID=A0A8A2UA13_9EURY|nr:hypothetical protein [Natrinema longum]MBZ6496638.1 hypothetical protein [Natrinema longum]QSW85464.1 hypothetical protein J0X27_01060 [Natrinema longum]